LENCFPHFLFAFSGQLFASRSLLLLSFIVHIATTLFLSDRYFVYH
jgi:hypothetical protein